MTQNQSDANAIAAFIAAKGKTVVPEGTRAFPPLVKGIVLSCESVLIPRLYAPWFDKNGIRMLVRHIGPQDHDIPETYVIVGKLKHAPAIEFGKPLCFPVQAYHLEIDHDSKKAKDPKNQPRYRLLADKMPYDPQAKPDPNKRPGARRG